MFFSFLLNIKHCLVEKTVPLTSLIPFTSCLGLK